MAGQQTSEGWTAMDLNRFREAARAGRAHGLGAALEALVLGPRGYGILRTAEVVEPILGREFASVGLASWEADFVTPSDIYAHLPTLYRTTRDAKLRRVLELGTRTGQSTVALLAAAKEIGGHVTSVDREACPEAEARVRKAGFDPYWTFLLADDTALDWREPIDHLFIDTSHEYDHTRAELRKYEPLVAPKGVITLHDTTSHPEVWRAVVDHFASRKDVRIFRYYHNNGLTVIERADPQESRNERGSEAPTARR